MYRDPKQFLVMALLRSSVISGGVNFDRRQTMESCRRVYVYVYASTCGGGAVVSISLNLMSNKIEISSFDLISDI
jgi:hypothetical protein